MAKSAVREMGVSEARANMTEVIAEVRLLGAPVVLTRRDKAQVVLVSVAWYEQALKYQKVAEAAVQMIGSAPNPDAALERLEELVGKAEGDAGPDFVMRRSDGSVMLGDVKHYSGPSDD